MKKIVLILALLCSSPCYAQQMPDFSNIQQQISQYLSTLQNKFTNYEQQALQMYYNAKAYVIEEMERFSGAHL